MFRAKAEKKNTKYTAKIVELIANDAAMLAKWQTLTGSQGRSEYSITDLAQTMIETMGGYRRQTVTWPDGTKMRNAGNFQFDTPAHIEGDVRVTGWTVTAAERERMLRQLLQDDEAFSKWIADLDGKEQKAALDSQLAEWLIPLEAKKVEREAAERAGLTDNAAALKREEEALQGNVNKIRAKLAKLAVVEKGSPVGRQFMKAVTGGIKPLQRPARVLSSVSTAYSKKLDAMWQKRKSIIWENAQKMGKKEAALAIKAHNEAGGSSRLGRFFKQTLGGGIKVSFPVANDLGALPNWDTKFKIYPDDTGAWVYPKGRRGTYTWNKALVLATVANHENLEETGTHVGGTPEFPAGDRKKGTPGHQAENDPRRVRR